MSSSASSSLQNNVEWVADEPLHLENFQQVDVGSVSSSPFKSQQSQIKVEMHEIHYTVYKYRDVVCDISVDSG